MNLTHEEIQVLENFRRIRTDWRRTFAFLTLQTLANRDSEKRTSQLQLVQFGRKTECKPMRKKAAQQPGALFLVGDAS